MRKLWRFSAAVSLVSLTGSLGCSTGASFTNPLGLGKSKPGTNLAAAPSFDKNYDQIAAAQRDRKIASPGLGMDQEVEASTAKKLSRSMTDNSVTKGIKSAWNKTAQSTSEVFTTRKGPPPSPISLSVDSGEPDADLCVAVARLEESKNNFAGAEKSYMRALDLDPNYKDALLGLARMHDRQGNLTKATAYYRQAAQAHPKDATAHNDLGLCYARQNRLQEAAMSLEKAIKLAPDKPLYRNNIAKVLVEMGYPDPALPHLAAAHGEAVAHYNIGCLLYDRGEVESSLEHFATAYQQDNQLTAAHEWTVLVQNELGIGAKAALASREPASATASDSQSFAQAPASAAPQLTPSWASDADHSNYPAAAPSPDGANGYAPVETDPAAFGGGESSHRLPPVDTAYRAPSRY